MAVETDADRAALLADFGESATWSHAGTTASITGIFDNPARILTGIGDTDSLARESTFLCAATDLPSGAGQGDTLTVGGLDYVVRALRPDGNGMARAELERVA